LTFNASKDAFYYVTIRRHSYGRTVEEARDRASKIQYAVSTRDSVLDLASGYAIDKDSKFRGQHVEIEILIPVGKKIRFDESINRKLNPVNINTRRRYYRNRGINIEINDDYWRQFRTGVDYTMDIDGNLKDQDGRKYNGQDYRYQDDRTDSLSIDDQLKEEKRKKDESEKRIKDLEEKQKQKKPVSGKLESMDDTDDAITSVGMPGFSLVKSFF
jgi:hypothetical protein